MKRALWLSALAIATLTGCTSIDRVQLDPETVPPAAVEISDARITIPKGIAIAVQAKALSGGDEIDDPIELIPRDPSIFGVGVGTDEKTFVLYGVSAGTTTLKVHVDDFDEEIPVEVPLQDTGP